MSKFMLRFLSVLLSLTILAGCGSAPAAKSTPPAPKGPVSEPAKPGDASPLGDLSGGEVEIEFWHIQATIYGDAIKEIVAEFNKKHAGQVKVKEIFQGSYADLNKKLRASIQGGGLPHVSMAYEADILEYMKGDVVIPLDPYISDAKWGLTKQELDDIMTGVLERQRIPQYEGKTMSWPHGNSSQGVYYNIDLLKQAGYDAPAKTWDEFVIQAQKIKEVTGVPALALGTVLAGSYINWIRTFGVTPVTSDGTMKFDDPAALTMLNNIKQMLDEGVAFIAQNTEQEFTNGRAAMEMGTTARTSSKIDLIGDKFNWGITLVPQGSMAVKPSTQLYGGNQVMFKSDAKAQLASWVFLKYFAGPEAQAIYAARTGYFPATISSQDTPLLKENYEKYPQKAQAFKEVFEYASIMPPSAALNTIQNDLNKVIEEVLANKLSTSDAVKKMQANSTKIFNDLAR